MMGDHKVKSIWAKNHPVSEITPRDIACPGCGGPFRVYGVEKHHSSIKNEEWTTVEWSGVCAGCETSWGVEFDE